VGWPKRGFALRLAGLAAAGVGLRALYLFTVGRDVNGAGDWHFYHWQANLIAEGRGFIEPFKFLFDHHVSPSAGHPPLYPLALASVSKLGGTGELSHRALGLILGACTIVLVGLLGRRAGGERLGLLAAGLCAVYPLMIAVDGALMSETLYGPLVAVALLAAWRMLDRPGAWIALATGAAIALAALTRSEALLLLVVLAWPAAWRGGAGWPLRAALSTLACALVLAPWAIRNADRFGAFVPISTNDSTVLAGANCPLTYHGIDLGGWNIDCISKRRDDNEADQAAIWRREATDYAREHAGRLPVVGAVRLLRVWDLWQPRRQVMFAEGRQRRVEQAGVAVYFAFLVLGAVGAVALHRRGVTLLVLLAPAVAVCIAAVLGYGIPRLRHGFEIPLLVLAAAGILRLVDARRAA
jgi:4-amino-4-deoxy-L-arabinose transferase-like glycosyltransferase